MKLQLSPLVFLVFLANPSVLAVAGPDHPAVYIDEGACPGEGCTFGTWKVKGETILYAEPNEKSKRTGKCHPGTEVSALTGQVNTGAGKFTVKKKNEEFNPGDIIWVYTYSGEGYFKVWVNGEFKEIKLGFSPWGGSSGTRCEVETYCWGELEKELNFTWWVKIQNVDGTIGWTNESNNFLFGNH